MTGGTGDRADTQFREIEVELAEDAPSGLLEDVISALHDAGTRRERPPLSKVARVLGDPAQGPPDLPVRGALDETATVDDFVRSTLTRSVRQLFAADPQLRLADDSDAVHDARVASRRLRSHLKMFEPCLTPGATDTLRRELSWLGAGLGHVRDSDVLLAALAAKIRLLPSTRRETASVFTDRLRATRARQRADLDEILASHRYALLLDRLVETAVRPPLVPGCGPEGARRVAARLDTAARRRLRPRFGACPQVPRIAICTRSASGPNTPGTPTRRRRRSWAGRPGGRRRGLRRSKNCWASIRMPWLPRPGSSTRPVTPRTGTRRLSPVSSPDCSAAIRRRLEPNGLRRGEPRGATSGLVERHGRRDPDVVDERVAVEAHALRRDVGSEAAVVHEVHDVDAAYEDEVVGDQAPMASPPQRLAAHDRRRRTCGDREQILDSGTELGASPCSRRRRGTRRCGARRAGTRDEDGAARPALGSTRSRYRRAAPTAASRPARTAGCGDWRETPARRPHHERVLGRAAW